MREWTDNQAIPTVAVVLPDARALAATLDLPGRLEAYSRAPIFARVSGYLKSWSADIGAQVKAGQVIAEIEAPDLDQQLLQARADHSSQQASAKLSEATLTRRKSLIASNFVSMQEIDERTADLSNKKAAVNSGQANVERLEALAGYKKITVPFDGVVTARDTDVGALINAGGGSGPPMFVVSDISKLRVYVNVPQNYVPSIKIGAKAVISMPEYPNRTFLATVEASSQSVDVGSGTTRMQLALDNAKGELMPGGYANVRMSLQRDTLPLHIPASALIFNKDGMRVATVGPDDKVLFKTVTIARDLGKDMISSPPASRRTTASSSRRPTASPTAIRSASPAPRAEGQNPRRLRRSRAARGRRRRTTAHLVRHAERSGCDAGRGPRLRDRGSRKCRWHGRVTARARDRE